MNKRNLEQTALADFIDKHIPSEADFKLTSSSASPTLIVPNQLNNQTEGQLLQKAFHYLFQLNVARETRAPFEANDLPAINGHLLVKKHHPYNLKYDYKFIVAKTRIEAYVHNEPYTIPYNRMAARIFDACYLFAQLDMIAESGQEPRELPANFYNFPKGSFIEEFEKMDELALAAFIPQLSPRDDARVASDLILNKQLIHTTTADNIEQTIHPTELAQIIFHYLSQKAKERFGSAPPLHSFHEVGLYYARFGEMKTLDLDAFYGEQLTEIVEKFHAYML